MTDTHVQHHTIDATGKRLGRVASQVAHLLMNKNLPTVVRHAQAPVAVTVTNTGKLLIDERKRTQKTYKRYSGYPGGLRITTLASLRARKGNAEILRLAVRGMLPNNKLRPTRMKALTIEE